MIYLEQVLRDDLEDAEKIVILGAGSVLKGDDAAAMVLIEKLQETIKDIPQVLLIAGSTAPENFTGLIKKFNPDRLFIIDAAHLEEEPGSIGIIEPELIKGLSFSTHMLPFSIMVNYLARETCCKISVIGIQPFSTEVGMELSEPVRKAVEELTNVFTSLIKERYQN